MPKGKIYLSSKKINSRQYLFSVWCWPLCAFKISLQCTIWVIFLCVNQLINNAAKALPLFFTVIFYLSLLFTFFGQFLHTKCDDELFFCCWSEGEQIKCTLSFTSINQWYCSPCYCWLPCSTPWNVKRVSDTCVIHTWYLKGKSLKS